MVLYGDTPMCLRTQQKKKEGSQHSVCFFFFFQPLSSIPVPLLQQLTGKKEMEL